MIQRTEPDVYLLTDIRFTGYITTYARWVHVTRAAMSDTPVAQLVATDLVETFTAELIAGDMTFLGDRTLRLFDSYADYFTRNLEPLLVEAPVLQRRTPNTFPTIVVSHWLLAAEYQLGRLRRYIRIQTNKLTRKANA